MIRRRLVATAAATLAIALSALTGGFFLVLTLRLDSDADRVLRARADAAAAMVTITAGRLRVTETPFDEALDTGVWVYDAAARPVGMPPAPGPADREAQLLARTAHPAFHDVGDLRLLAIPLQGRATPGGTVVAALSLSPYHQAELTALIAALVFDALILGLGALFVRRAVIQALRPVAWMTRQAARWSEHDPDRKFGLGPSRDELSGLAAILDNLLGRLSAALRHEQRVTAEIAHELRTPLAQLRLETEIALRRDRPAEELRSALTTVLQATDRMTGALDTLIGLAQRSISPSGGTAVAMDVAKDALRGCRDLAGDARLDLDGPVGSQELLVGCDHDVVLRMLQPLLDNAFRFCRSAVRLRVSGGPEGILFAVWDDGPGFVPEELDAVVQPGAQGSAALPGQGAGLGLALARRLAEAAGGRLTPQARRGGGLVELHLPAVPAQVGEAVRADHSQHGSSLGPENTDLHLGATRLRS